jgi:fructokinase
VGASAWGSRKLLPMIRVGTVEILGGYVAGITVERLKEMIRAPELGALAGPLGAVALGYESLRS